MNATIVIYGSSTGTCEAIAEKIASKLGCEAVNVQNLTADVINNHQNLILPQRQDHSPLRLRRLFDL